MKTYIAIFTLIFSLSANAQTPNFKHDIGFKFSSYQPESFQLEYRFHLNEKWAFSANAYYGERGNYYSSGYYVIQDSLYQLNTSQYLFRTYGMNLAAIRKLDFMKHNFYYVGGGIGYGVSSFSNRSNRLLYEPLENDPTFTYAPHPAVGNVVEEEQTATIRNSMQLKSRVFIGADIPVVDRLTLNFQLGFLALFEHSSQDMFNYYQLSGSFSGGLRYRFGKTEGAGVQ